MQALDDKEDFKQRQYYQRTAQQYEAMHVRNNDEHYFALSLLSGVIADRGYLSVLDIGSGTGRAIGYLKRHHGGMRVLGVEPSESLRRIGHSQGIAETELIDGDATQLEFADGSFDVVCEFGVLHHLREPGRAVKEMLRVARKAVFISDDNHFAAGSPLLRLSKRWLASLGAWRLAYLIKTRGKGYRYTEGDGISYAYSVFDDLALLKAGCAQVYMTNTTPGGPDLFRTASHIALLGIKAD